MPGHGMGIFCRDQAELFDGLTAAADGGGDALMAIGLDANCFAEAQGLRDRCRAHRWALRCGPPIPAVHLQEAETPATTTEIKLASAVTGGTDPRRKYHSSTSFLMEAFLRSRTAVLMAIPTPARDARNPAAGLTMASLHSRSEMPHWLTA